MREPSVIKQKRPQQIDSIIDRIINISDHVIGLYRIVWTQLESNEDNIMQSQYYDTYHTTPINSVYNT